VLSDKSVARRVLLEACDLLSAIKSHLPSATTRSKPGHQSVFAAYQIAEAQFFDAAADFVREHGED
jgi:hypothetical protein